MQLAEPRAAHSTQAIFPPTVAGFIVELRLLVNCRAAFGRSAGANHYPTRKMDAADPCPGLRWRQKEFDANDGSP